MTLHVWFRVDDPVGASAVHGVAGLWSMVAAGLFCKKDNLENYSVYDGLLHGGGFQLLGVQLLASLCCIVYSAITTFIIIFLLSKCIRFRYVIFLRLCVEREIENAVIMKDEGL